MSLFPIVHTPLDSGEAGFCFKTLNTGDFILHEVLSPGRARPDTVLTTSFTEILDRKTEGGPFVEDHLLPEPDQNAFLRPLIRTGARPNPATGGPNNGNCRRRFNPTLFLTSVGGFGF